MDEWARCAVPKASSVVRVSLTPCQNQLQGPPTDVDVAERREALAELFDLLLVGLDLGAVLVLGRALLLNVEAEVLEENNLAVVGLVHDRLDLGADAVRRKGDLLAQQLLELRHDRL